MFPLPPAFRKKLLGSASASASDDPSAPNPLGVSESEEPAVKKGSKPNPLKNWADAKLAGK